VDKSKLYQNRLFLPKKTEKGIQIDSILRLLRGLEVWIGVGSVFREVQAINLFFVSRPESDRHIDQFKDREADDKGSDGNTESAQSLNPQFCSTEWFFIKQGHTQSSPPTIAEMNRNSTDSVINFEAL
jgi:hypothetical protein